MHNLFAIQGAAFEGLMVSLYAGSHLVAAHFGVRQGDWFHPWIGAIDPDLKAYSPGLVHQIEAIGAMAGLGLRTYDLGPSNDHWKRMFTQGGGGWIGAGLATPDSITGQLARASETIWRAPLIGRLRGRIDQIAALELTVGGRLSGAAQALASIGGVHRRRRHLARSTPWALS